MSIIDLIAREEIRQQEQISLIASENYVSKAVRQATGSVLMNKYAEGYPGKRYYAGNNIIDELENQVISLAKQLFQTDYQVNVQPLSGTPANLAVYSALLQPGDTILAMSLDQGGHLSHGHPVSLTGQIYNFIHYGVDPDSELIDYERLVELAKEHKPKLIVCGGTSYPAQIDFKEFNRIARESQSLLMVDMSHLAGLVAGGAHASPFNIADVITTTTHKTLRGPRGAIIFSRPNLGALIDKAVFPGLQGGPHMHTIAAIGVALEEALQPAFRSYIAQTVENAKILAYTLQREGFRLVADGTETHLILLDLKGTGLDGQQAQDRLAQIGIICNKNSIPYDPGTPGKPSGIRLGTPAVTTRGMKEKEMESIGNLISTMLGSGSRSTPEAVIINSAQSVRQLARKFKITV